MYGFAKTCALRLFNLDLVEVLEGFGVVLGKVVMICGSRRLAEVLATCFELILNIWPSLTDETIGFKLDRLREGSECILCPFPCLLLLFPPLCPQPGLIIVGGSLAQVARFS